jgi:type II secretory pathway component PulK
MNRERPRRHDRGVALPVALALLLILALLLTQALGGAAGETALVANYQFRQAAFEAAEGGLVAGRQRLLSTDGVSPPPLDRAVDGSPVDRSVTQFSYRGVGNVVAGYSADRFVPRHFELRSTGRSARGARIVLTEGVDRLDPLP